MIDSVEGGSDMLKSVTETFGKADGNLLHSSRFLRRWHVRLGDADLHIVICGLEIGLQLFW